MFTSLRRRGYVTKSLGKEGKRVHEHLPKRGKAAATFIAMLLVITFTATYLPKATATPTLTVSIHPISGTVGTKVEVNGTIDTLNGSYTIRWNGTLNVTTSYATGYNVTTSFAIPQTIGAPSGRDVLIELVDNTVDNVVNTTFTLYTKYHIEAVVPSPPSQLQEGRITDILVNVTGGEANTVYSANITVTDPSGAVYYNDTLQLTNTTNTGYGEGNIAYPADFSLDSNTDYVGLYTIALNETLATETFTVGLTDRLEYGRTETEVVSVHIRGVGYSPDKLASVNITIAGETVAGYPELTLADAEGVVTYLWRIPKDAQLGIYTVTLANETGVQIKPVPDIQNFTVTEVTVYCKTQNKYDKEALAGVSVGATLLGETYVTGGMTNGTGWIDLKVSYGNYTFKAFWKNVEVGSLNCSVLENTILPPIECELAHLTITIKDETRFSLPFINVTLASNKTGVLQFETNNTGTVRTNTFTNVSYTIEAWRYGHLFNTTQIANLTVTEWINIICPTLTLLVNVLDSKGIALKNVEVQVYEWTSGVAEPVQSNTTDDLGRAFFQDLTFGRYKIWVYNEEHMIILNQTVVDLTEDQLPFVVHCKIVNVDLSVVVKDYFGQPISNALVEVKRENETISQKTGSKGKYSFHNITGGDCQISVTVMGKVSETRTLYLDEAKVIVFKLGKFAVVGGFLLEVTQLIAYISLGIVIIVFALALIYRRRRPRKLPEGEEKEKSL
jgi:hypothetical protein